MIIIIILKLDSGIDPVQGPSGSTLVFLGQCKDKIIIIVVLKLDLGVDLEPGGLTWLMYE
jgi:hypothetical protein